ncbi:MAG: hypothetical protein ABEJ31_12545 [Haloarculaceae archaeon]
MAPLPATTVFADQPSLAFVAFIAFSLMFALGVRFALYAYWNLRATELAAQAVLWEYLVVVGLTAALYGLLGGIEAATSVTPGARPVATPYRTGVLLATLLMLSLTMREIAANGALSNADGDAAGSGRRQLVEMGFVLLVAAAFAATGLAPRAPGTIVIVAVSALAIAAYGRRQLTASSVRGTMIDSLLRHLLPVVAFALLVLTLDVGVLAGLALVIVRHIQVVFVIMTATTLMTATIKLRQNVAGF